MNRAVLEGRAEWKREWGQLDGPRRRLIKTSVNAGQAMLTEADAALAVGLAQRFGRQTWRLFLFPWIYYFVGRRSWRQAVKLNLRLAHRAVDR